MALLLHFITPHVTSSTACCSSHAVVSFWASLKQKEFTENKIKSRIIVMLFLSLLKKLTIKSKIYVFASTLSISQPSVPFQGHWVHAKPTSQVHSHRLTLHLFPVSQHHLNTSSLLVLDLRAQRGPKERRGWERDLPVKVKHIVHWINAPLTPPPPIHFPIEVLRYDVLRFSWVLACRGVGPSAPSKFPSLFVLFCAEWFTHSLPF